MTEQAKSPAEIAREALLVSQADATIVGALANEFAGHGIAAAVMPALAGEHRNKARALLARTEALARSLNRLLDDNHAGGPSYVFAMSAPEFATLLTAFAAYKAIIARHGEDVLGEGFGAIADRHVATPLVDVEAIDVFIERLASSAARQDGAK